MFSSLSPPILTNNVKILPSLLVNMDSSGNDGPPAPEVLPPDVVRYVIEASSEEREALCRYVEELESTAGPGTHTPEKDFKGSQSPADENSKRSNVNTDEFAKASDSINETDTEDTTEGETNRDGLSEDPPEDVPSNATLTIKEINNNRYYYWQWRDGEKIRSKYKSPVSNDS